MIFKIAFNELNRMINKSQYIDHCIYADDLYIHPSPDLHGTCFTRFRFYTVFQISFFLFLSHSTKCYCVWTRALCTHLTGNPELMCWLAAHAHCVCISSHKIKVLSTENCIWVKVSQFQKDLIFLIRSLQVNA